MKLIFAIGIIAVIAVVGSRLIFIQNKLPIGIRHLLITGTEYILIGALLGGAGLNIIDSQTFKDLEPFLVFGLCWIGFLFGLQFEIRLMKNLPRYYFSLTFIQSAIVFLVVCVSSLFATRMFPTIGHPLNILISLTLGSMAACTAQSAIAIINKRYRIQNRPLSDLLRYISSVDGLFALIFYAVSLIIISSYVQHSFYFLNLIRYISFFIMSGLIPAFVLIFLSRTRFLQQEYIVFVLGAILFCGGLAFQLQVPPLVAGLICGFITANFCRHRLRAMDIVVHSEKTIYIILLLIIGAAFQLSVTAAFAIAAVYVSTRIFGKLAGAFLATKLFRPRFTIPANVGLSLLAEGGVAAAIVLNTSIFFPAIKDILITVLIISLLMNELMAPRFILRHLVEINKTKPANPVSSRES